MATKELVELFWKFIVLLNELHSLPIGLFFERPSLITGLKLIMWISDFYSFTITYGFLVVSLLRKETKSFNLETIGNNWAKGQ